MKHVNKIEVLKPTTYDGMLRFCREYLKDAPAMENFAWLWFLLREAEDKPEWFPSGKKITLERMERMLETEAKAVIRANQPRPN